MTKEVVKKKPVSSGEIANADPFLFPHKYQGIDGRLLMIVKEVYRRYKELKYEKPEWLRKLGERDEEVFYLKERIAKWEEFGRRVKERELRIPKQKEGGMNPALIIIDDKMEEPDERE